MDTPIRILMLEDDPADAELVVRELRKADLEFIPTLAKDKAAFLAALEGESPDLVLADYSLPGFDGLSAMSLARERFGHLPVIIVSGAIGEETAIEALKAGATDYVLKQRLSRLGPVVERALDEAREQADRRAAREALHRSEARYRSLFENMVEGFALHEIVTDEEGRPCDYRFIDVNPAFERITGLKAADIRRRTVREVLPGIEDVWIETYGKVALTGESVRFEDYSAELGRWYGVVAYRPAPGRFAAIFSDITERKRIEDALRETAAERQLLASVVERSSQAFGVGYPDGRLGEVNPAFEALTGYSAEELRSIDWNRTLTPPEWRESEAKRLAELRRTGRPVRYEKEYVRKDGARVPVELLVHLSVDDAGEPQYYYSFISDITERKRAEQALKDLNETLERRVEEQTAEVRQAYETAQSERQRLFDVLETLPAMICLLTADYHVAFANRAFRERFGESQGRHCYEYCFGRSEPCEFCESFEVLRTGRPHHWEVGSPDGTVIDAYDFPFTDVDGTPMVLEMDLDITELRRNERALAQRTAEVEDLADQLRALASDLTQTEQRERRRLANVLHDHVQQLLAAACLQVGWLKREADDGRPRAKVQAVDSILREAIQACRSLAVDLSPPVLHEAGLAGALSWLASRMREQHGLAVQVRSDTRAEPASEELRFLLLEGVRELLFNIVKHAGVSEAEVTLVKTADGLAQVVVRDEGRGFDPELLKKRGPQETTFGLFSIRERLAYLGGWMAVESAPGEGTTITLTAPLGEAEAPADRSQEAAPAPGPEKTEGPARNGEHCRVLIVDDHEIMREGLVQLFQFESDIDVVGEASDGEQAIELAETLDPDVIIMDVNLGAMSGVEATRKILSRTSRPKVIGLSMHEDRDVADSMRGAGASAYLTKDGPSKELIAAVRACREE